MPLHNLRLAKPTNPTNSRRDTVYHFTYGGTNQFVTDKNVFSIESTVRIIKNIEYLKITSVNFK